MQIVVIVLAARAFLAVVNWLLGPATPRRKPVLPSTWYDDEGHY